MASDDERPPGARPYVKFSAAVARAVCLRIAAGETQVAIAADPDMPSRATLGPSPSRPAFANILARAKALAGREGLGPNSTWCPVIAHEIVARLAEGESLTTIAQDPAMPSMGTMFYWRKAKPEFAEAMRLAREALAERFSDMGWAMAMQATPETAYLTHVRLGQLRWTAAILGPRIHGRLKPTEPPQPPQVTTICYCHFEIEAEPGTGRRRVIGGTPDPDTLKPVREAEGSWTGPVDPVAKAAAIQRLTDEREAREAPSGPPPDDPKGWC